MKRESSPRDNVRGFIFLTFQSTFDTMSRFHDEILIRSSSRGDAEIHPVFQRRSNQIQLCLFSLLLLLYLYIHICVTSFARLFLICFYVVTLYNRFYYYTCIIILDQRLIKITILYVVIIVEYNEF